ncbi:adenomatous polyposis coli protein, partial [Caerostris extrusa]
GLQAIAELLRVDQWAHGVNNDPHCTTLRRYLGMSLTNLTFGDGANKALLCSMRPFMEALVAQLYSPSEDLRQVTASVLRNLSWRADPPSKRALRDVGAVPSLVRAALSARKDSTLKSVLSALWNLSAHCSANKADICREEGRYLFWSPPSRTKRWPSWRTGAGSCATSAATLPSKTSTALSCGSITASRSSWCT